MNAKLASVKLTSYCRLYLNTKASSIYQDSSEERERETTMTVPIDGVNGNEGRFRLIIVVSSYVNLEQVH